MDEISGFLDGPRARDAFLITSIFDPPWAIRVRDEAPLTVVVMLRGGCWIRHDDAAPVRLGPGDVALVSGPDPYVVADDLATEPTVVVHPGQVCTDLAGRSMSVEMALGVRAWGTALDGSAVCLTGVYTGQGEVGRRLLGVLPRVVVLRREEWQCPYVGALAEQVQVEAPGQATVLDRLLDLLLIHALRAWFARTDARSPGWYAAHGDAVVGPVLRALREDPARPWTVTSLAREAGVSRSLLARRFTELVGEPPMAYLTGLRLALAADLLADPEVNVSSVATRVGYASPFTFSTAFKRHHGLSPSEWRRTGVGAAVSPSAGRVTSR